MDNRLMFSSEKQDWETPQSLFDELNKKYNFETDAAATRENAKCKMFFSEKDNALEKNWGGYGNIFCNPPYESKLQNDFIKKAYEESLKPEVGTIVLLIPARTDTKRWHDYILGKAEVEFLKGRLKFESDGVPHKNPAPFPSALVIFSKEG
ncbi:DNA N-6-adenine-methyltransferase [Carnobacterium maltaromaticum]|uniref:DNA N-6-adenine-methyltransferase n=1 Tax=Carnobacterium maltaromaticum TaxID=2751 RepID=UPI00298BC1CA|nr:DNA N-6-adenine-methyltransferase [Carnobacterium maltaromaticum]MDW5524608.1 DNA N-6-adenine-methyltransferase [Carnobacterium maltaromaticum]